VLNIFPGTLSSLALRNNHGKLIQAMEKRVSPA
jgi:hypothetical protein